jgi:TetR/AcrR family transcriptional regulator, cholesterol catabolism regulator
VRCQAVCNEFSTSRARGRDVRCARMASTLDNISLTRKGASTRARIIEVAARMFAKRGFEGASLQDVADTVGISKTAIYHHFKSKDEILVALHHGLIDRIIERQEDRSQGARTAKEMLRAFIGDLIELMHEHPTHLRVFLELYRHLPPRARRDVDTKRQQFIVEFHQLLETGQRGGEFKFSGDIGIVAQALLGMFWSHQHIALTTDLSTAEVTETLYRLALGGLAHHETK